MKQNNLIIFICYLKKNRSPTFAWGVFARPSAVVIVRIGPPSWHTSLTNCLYADFHTWNCSFFAIGGWIRIRWFISIDILMQQLLDIFYYDLCCGKILQTESCLLFCTQKKLSLLLYLFYKNFQFFNKRKPPIMFYTRTENGGIRRRRILITVVFCEHSELLSVL